MVNTEDFIKRLEIILDYYNLNASSFADKIGVQRSSLSHLLSGRNKPSLDFILKILDVFPDVDLYWIINGKGTFPKSAENQQMDFTGKDEQQKATPIIKNKEISVADLFSENQKQIPGNQPTTQKPHNLNAFQDHEDDAIDKIVIFYKDGTFKSYRPN
ncbi:Helix-turn-helix [Flavobacterium micromati]|jgi:transcriptional regulator with XRE-family HTH domain|uniref:Helix-turn-helix n=1 Tax=Flavobacterium micromati TaxID=229205 RepID=A0A1M5JJM4_9FLAO|nr:helix-turn-helix transcriptional regulator [Flavobacterium micromati]SHG40233.1 Helix-turn-helix [Flavobacterium micromati]